MCFVNCLIGLMRVGLISRSEQPVFSALVSLRLLVLEVMFEIHQRGVLDLMASQSAVK